MRLKRHVGAAGLLLGLFGPAGVDAGELVVLGAQGNAFAPGDPLNTGAFDCHGYGAPGFLSVPYVVPTTFQLKALSFFVGAWNRVIADIGWKLWNETTGRTIYWTNWDRYNPPTNPQPYWIQFPAGDSMTLRQGDVLRLDVYCSDFSGFGFTVQAHVAATLYGTRVP